MVKTNQLDLGLMWILIISSIQIADTAYLYSYILANWLTK